MPQPLSHKCSIPTSQLCSHFMCVQCFHMVNIDVPARVHAPPLDSQELMSGETTKECVTTAYAWVPSKSQMEITLNGTRVTCSFGTSPLITSCFSSTCAWYLALYQGLPYFQFLRLQAINWSQGRLGNKTTWRCHTYLPKASEVQTSLYLGHFRWPQWRLNHMKYPRTSGALVSGNLHSQNNWYIPGNPQLGHLRSAKISWDVPASSFI